jgi:hypothetical protein
MIRAETQPGGEVVLVLPARHVQTDFTDDGLRDAHIDAINPRQVDPANPKFRMTLTMISRNRNHLAAKQASTSWTHSAALESGRATPLAASAAESAMQERIQRHVRDRTMSMCLGQAPGGENDRLGPSTWTRLPPSTIAERTCAQ